MRALVRVEMPLVHVLQRMEDVGIAVDPASLAKHKVCQRPLPPILQVLPLLALSCFTFTLLHGVLAEESARL